MVEQTQDAQTVQIKRVRLSFPTLREKKATTKDGKEKFSVSFIIDPNTPQGKANIVAIGKAVEAAEIKEFKKPGVIAKTVQDPKRKAFRRGETFMNKEGDIYNGYEGMVGVTTNADKRPKLWDRRKELVELENIEDVFYGGTFCDAKVRFFCVSDTDKGGNGLFAQVLAIRSHQEGEPFGAVDNTTSDEFDDLDELDDGGAGDSDDLLG